MTSTSSHWIFFPTLVLNVISNQNLSYYKSAIDVCFHCLLIGSRILNCKEDSSADHYCGLERSHKGSKTGSIEFCSRPWVGIPQYYDFKHLIFFSKYIQFRNSREQWKSHMDMVLLPHPASTATRKAPHYPPEVVTKVKIWDSGFLHI